MHSYLYLLVFLSDSTSENPSATDGAMNPSATDGAVNPSATDGAVNPSATDGAVNPSATNGAVNPSATNGAVNPSATDGAVDPSATDGAVNPSATDGAVNPSATDGAVDPSATDGAVNPSATDGAVNPSATNGVVNPSATDGSVNPSAADGGVRPSSTMDAEMSTVPGKIFIPVIPVNRKLTWICRDTCSGNFTMKHLKGISSRTTPVFELLWNALIYHFLFIAGINPTSTTDVPQPSEMPRDVGEGVIQVNEDFDNITGGNAEQYCASAEGAIATAAGVSPDRVDATCSRGL